MGGFDEENREDEETRRRYGGDAVSDMSKMYSDLAAMYAMVAKLEGMKAANSQYPEDQPHPESDFVEVEKELESIAEQLWRIS